MKFIKLTRDRNGARIYLACEKIESIETSATSDHVTKYSSDSSTTTIITDSKDIFEVKETPEEIFKLLEFKVPSFSGKDIISLGDILSKPDSNRHIMKIKDIIEEYNEEMRLNEPDPDYIRAEQETDTIFKDISVKDEQGNIIGKVIGFKDGLHQMEVDGKGIKLP